jgi:hypothetical protein
MKKFIVKKELKDFVRPVSVDFSKASQVCVCVCMCACVCVCVCVHPQGHFVLILFFTGKGSKWCAF